MFSHSLSLRMLLNNNEINIYSANNKKIIISHCNVNENGECLFSLLVVMHFRQNYIIVMIVKINFMRSYFDAK